MCFPALFSFRIRPEDMKTKLLALQYLNRLISLSRRSTDRSKVVQLADFHLKETIRPRPSLIAWPQPSASRTRRRCSDCIGEVWRPSLAPAGVWREWLSHSGPPGSLVWFCQTLAAWWCPLWPEGKRKEQKIQSKLWAEFCLDLKLENVKVDGT